MAKLTVIGRLGNVKTVGNNKDYVSIGVAEPSYKKDDEYVTPWFNFLIKADSPIAKFLSTNAEKIDVVEVIANERESKNKDNATTYFHNVTQVNVVTWKKTNDSAEVSASDEESGGDGQYPWSN